MPIPAELSSRIHLPVREELPPDGQRIYDSILATRGNLDGPFLAWLHCPQLADPAEKLGAFCRYHTGLTTLESELLILLVAAHYRCSGEWQIHAPIALKAGLSEQAVVAISAGRRPRLQPPRLQLLCEFASELLSTGRVSATRLSQLQQQLGDAGTVALVGLVGYYSLVALTLNTFDMRFRDRPDPFIGAGVESRRSPR